MSTKWICWTDPHNESGVPVFCFMKEEDILKYMREKLYEGTDEELLDDFCTINFAHRCYPPDMTARPKDAAPIN